MNNKKKGYKKKCHYYNINFDIILQKKEPHLGLPLLLSALGITALALRVRGSLVHEADLQVHACKIHITVIIYYYLNSKYIVNIINNSKYNLNK